QGRIPSDEEIETARSIVGSENVVFDLETRAVSFRRRGVTINLGGIGKGYALDVIARSMKSKVNSALLSAGSSSIPAIGSAEIGAGDHRSQGWKIGIRHPVQTRARLAILTLRDSAMSTSGSEEQCFEVNGRRYGHVIDPRSGRPAEGVSSVTVISESAAVCD